MFEFLQSHISEFTHWYGELSTVGKVIAPVLAAAGVGLVFIVGRAFWQIGFVILTFFRRGTGPDNNMQMVRNNRLDTRREPMIEEGEDGGVEESASLTLQERIENMRRDERQRLADVDE